MKSRLPFWALLISGMLFFVSCSNDDDPTGGNNLVPQTVLDAFQSQYGSTRADWSVENGYAVARFSNGASESRAWYALTDASWEMTEREIPFSSLPQAIRTVISESAYADWMPDDEVDVLDRNGAERLYVVEMEKGDVEVDLYFTENGLLVKEVVDSDKGGNDYSGYLPQTPASGIYSWIEQHYPNASIVDVEQEGNGVEVDILYNGMKHEILFDASSAWIQTKTEYGRRNMPEVVRLFVEANYAHYTVDDVERYETGNGVYYCIELERGDFEKKVYLNEQGEEIARPSTGNTPAGGSVQVTTGIESFLQTTYPGATITEKEYDDGRIEVEIIHDGREKEVLFTLAEEWIRTTYDIRFDELPEAVKAALTREFGANTLWDNEAECVETPEGTFYEVETRNDIDVYISAEGVIQWTER